MPLCIKIIRQLILILIFLIAADTTWAVKLKIATLSPQGSMWMVKMQAGAKEVAQKTNSRVTFKFYPGAVMGEDETVLKKIRAGQLHGGAMVGGSLSRFFPANQIYAQPLKFSQIEEVDHVRKHLDQYIVDGLDENGFVTFGLMGAGFAYIMSKNPIETVEDLRTQKVWVLPENKSSQESLQAFGVTPIPLSLSDVLTGLQTGLINTVATSPVGAITLQWHDQIKYVTNLKLHAFHRFLDPHVQCDILTTGYTLGNDISYVLPGCYVDLASDRYPFIQDKPGGINTGALSFPCDIID